jgi:hypothetical protein
MNRGLLILLPALLVAGSPKAQMPPGFDPQQVVRQVRSSHSTTRPLDHSATGLDDGEFLVDTVFDYVPAGDMQWYSAVAFGDSVFLVVWNDLRSNLADIYGARVNRDGHVLDPAGIRITVTAYEEGATAVAFDGANFLVVWEDVRGGNSSDIYGARVSPAGTVLDPDGIAISPAAENQLNPAVAFDNPNFLVVWSDWRGGTRGTRVSPAGTVLDPDGIVITTESHDNSTPAVATDGTDFLVVWQDERNGYPDHIHGARVDEAGVVLDPDGIRISLAGELQEFPAVAFGGTNFLVVWLGWDNHDLLGARVTCGGAVLDTDGIFISTTMDGYEPPAVAFDGTNFLVAWQDYRDDISGARVSRAGTVLDPDGIAISTAAGFKEGPALAFDGTDFLAVWQDGRGQDPYDIYGARVSPAGTVLDPEGIAVSTAAGWQYFPAVASDGSDFLVVWQEERDSGGTDIYGARVNSSGGILDPGGFAITAPSDTHSRPALAFNGTNFLVVWEQYVNHWICDLYGARVSPDGTVLDPDGIAISTAAGGQRSSALASDGTNFLVVWEDWRSGNPQVYCARVSQTGTVLDPDGIAISTVGFNSFPAVVFDSTNFLVAWSAGNIYGARVSPGGIVLDSGGFAISPSADAQRDPAIAFDGTNSLVVWRESRIDTSYKVCGARVSQTGTVLDSAGIAISTSPGYADHPAVAFDGTDFLVVWQGARVDECSDIYGARVSPGRSAFGGGAVVTQQGNQYDPTLASGSGGQMLLTYRGWTGTVGGKPYNIDRIWGKLDPDPGIQESPKPQAPSDMPGATIVRGVLLLPPAPRSTRYSLLTADGRQVMKLKPGENDVSRLAAGVYFLSLETSYRRASFKLVLTR